MYDTEDDTEGMIAGELSRLGSQYGIESSSDDLDSEIIYWQNRLRTAFENEASKQISSYLDDYGHIESNISIGDGFEPTFDLKALLPLWESDEDLLLFQSSMNSLGKHDDDARNILNFGIGYRHWNDTFMYVQI
ncbi:inverse autotransporter beta domain-containing protein [Aeromonas veronii]|uniref:inverse autotransporter beta domain-containing protein n=1 Tax=Aeromonas veronii TaxID=654 RepID=UPI00207D1A36|nr:inverse autotransporter beta domain-containing protein [Aeromonas veronii]MCO4174522.1 inverse autotransporter beta domain-containing protein [Aeromonas veronii]